MTRIGYARTSTADQNIAAQIDALKAAGCEDIREEQESGASLEGRPQLNTILDFIHAGETLVVTRIDRLARSLRDLQVIVDKLKAKGAHLVATEQPVDTSTVAGEDGHLVTPDLAATLSPYMRWQIRRFGKYDLDMDDLPEPLAPGPLLSKCACDRFLHVLSIYPNYTHKYNQ